MLYCKPKGAYVETTLTRSQIERWNEYAKENYFDNIEHSSDGSISYKSAGRACETSNAILASAEELSKLKIEFSDRLIT